MPAVSKKQQMAAGIATAIQEGKMSPQPGTPSAQMAKSMKPAAVQEFARTPRKSLPVQVKPVKAGVKQIPWPK